MLIVTGFEALQTAGMWNLSIFNGTTEHEHIREYPLDVIAKLARLAELNGVPRLNPQIAAVHHPVVLIGAHDRTRYPKPQPSSHTIQRIRLRTFHRAKVLQRTNTNR